MSNSEVRRKIIIRSSGSQQAPDQNRLRWLAMFCAYSQNQCLVLRYISRQVKAGRWVELVGRLHGKYLSFGLAPEVAGRLPGWGLRVLSPL